MSTRICPKCGKVILDDHILFCPECGTKWTHFKVVETDSSDNDDVPITEEKVGLVHWLVRGLVWLLVWSGWMVCSRIIIEFWLWLYEIIF